MPEQRVSYANCSLCEASCGLEVVHDGRRIESVRGDPRDALSGGYICPKAVALKDIHEDPDRLKRPLRRIGKDFSEVSWDEAFGVVADRLAGVRREHGDNAIGLYVGNPLGHSYAGVLSGLLLGAVLGTRQRYSAQSVDALPRVFVVYQMYGNQALLPVPDLDRTEHLLVFGANPVVSNGSIMTAPNVKRRLRALRERGGRVVVVDPRRTETAMEASEHVFVRPGSDALLLFAMLHEIFERKLERLGHLSAHVKGLSRVKELARSFSPDRVAAATGVSADTIRRLATEFAAARRAVCYGRVGTSTQRFGALATWLIEVLNVVTGNLDRPGGSMFNTPALDLPSVARALGQRGSYATFHSRVGGLPEFAHELPVAALADEIETAGSGQIRALVTVAGNPVLSLPNGERLDRAFASLDFMVSVDIYLNETTRHADVILPTTFGLERDDYPILASAMAVRNHARYAPAVVEPSDGALHDWQVIGELSAGLLERRGTAGRAAARLLRGLLQSGEPRHVLELMLALGPHGLRRGKNRISVSRLGEHGVDLGALEPRLPGVLATPDRQIDLAPEPLCADVARLSGALAEHADPKPFVLIGRRQLRSNNSWMHNSPRLMAGRPRCTLLIHPDDAARIGVTAGSEARVSSRVGSVVANVELSDEIMPGVVSLPHGFGHARAGARLSVAGANAGVSINDLTDERLYDELCGTSHFNGVPVEVTRA